MPRPYLVHQAAVEVDEAGAFVDCGRWREKGVTHWHLVAEEWALDPATQRIRFDNDRVNAAKLRPQAVAWSPQEALDWLLKAAHETVARSTNPQHLLANARLLTEDDWRLKAEVSFYLLMHGRSSGSGLLVSPGRTADAMAYAMTARDCAGCAR